MVNSCSDPGQMSLKRLEISEQCKFLLDAIFTHAFGSTRQLFHSAPIMNDFV